MKHKSNIWITKKDDMNKDGSDNNDDETEDL